MVSLLSLKVLLISSGVLFIGLVCKMSVPLVLDFSTSQAPVIWGSFLSWLKPPYLYIIINGIIITIVASSRFYQNHENDHHQQQVYERPSLSKDLPDTHPLPYDYEMKMKNVPMEEIRFGDLDRTVVAVFDKTIVVEVNDGPVEEEEEEQEDGENNEFVLSKSTWAPLKRTDSSEIPSEYLSPVEKPLVSARFCHRKPVKASPEGARALRVSKPKRQETLESTWKAITEGRAMPLTRHLKKSDTWENHARQINVNVDPSPVKKSETFKDRTNYQSPPVTTTTTTTPSPLKLTREPSLSQDELNRRVEAFIKKFNEEMRLQRQESLNQYKEMINRGTP